MSDSGSTPPPEVSAQSKFHCPACGAEATWNPAKQALVCGFCGTTSPAKLEAVPGGEDQIVEHDLLQALRGVRDEDRGWQTEKVSVRCQSCNAISVFDPDKVAKNCDFCGSAALVAYDEIKAAFRPESLLPLKLSENQVRDSIRTWYRSRWFAPNKLGSRAMTDTVKAIYIPYWTFDAQVYASWTAESGYYYYETESYTDSNGNRQERSVQRVRWEWSSGQLQHFFDDELVPASKGIDYNLLRNVEPFPTKDLVVYNPGFLAGWVVERYQIDLGAAAKVARDRMESDLHGMCSRQVPGDTQRNLRVSADWSGQTFKHILAPVWLLTYDYFGKPYHVLINGYTGRMAGTYPKSWIKILFAVLGGIIVVLIFVALMSRNR
ncbi:MAG TPA: zinc ribbon domain-containing protein [Candidatus Limnocylindria bacterium]|nr:zinc ribbon domain-containing protein [Candidatus Limnocylindria bacterium]